MIEFIFQGKTVSMSALLAKRFESQLLLAGLDRSSVSLCRSTQETMDLGTIVQVASGLGHSLAAGAEMAAPFLAVPHCAMLIWQVCKPGHAGVIIRTRDGHQVEIPESEIEIDHITKVLSALDLAQGKDDGRA